MAHASRLTKALRHDRLAAQRMADDEALLLPLICDVCGCTEDDACIIPGVGPCSWKALGLCSNPECVNSDEGRAILAEPWRRL